MEMEEEDFNHKKTKPPYYPDLHLKSAIREYDRRFFTNYLVDKNRPLPLTVKNSVISWINSPNNRGNGIRSDSERIYGRLFSPIFKEQYKFSQSKRQLFENVGIAKDFIKSSIDLLFDGFHDMVDVPELKTKFSGLSLCDKTIDLFIYRNLWESMRDVMKDKQIENNYSYARVDQDLLTHKIYANSFFMIIEDGGVCWLMDYQQVLMVSDNIGSRFMSFLFLELNEQLGRTDLPIPQDLRTLYDWGDSVLLELGNEGYNVIKQLESLCVGTYLKHHEPLSVSQEYRDKLLEQSNDKPLYKKHLSELCNFLDSLVQHPNKLLEIFGCYRHFGHPTVNEIEGIKVLKDNSTESLSLNETCLVKCSGAFNRSFVFCFLQKQRRWPKCSIREGENPSRAFRDMVEKRPQVISEYDLEIDLADWATLEFEQEFEFEDYEDLVSLLSDTSISPYRDNWYSVYSNDLLNCKKPTNVMESRRVLIEMIKRTDLSCKRIRETIQERDYIPVQWFIVGLHSKEREIKIKARLFAMLCIEIRLYFSMTEKNLAEKIFPYVPFQTMTWSDADLSKTLLDLTSKGRTTQANPQRVSEVKNVHVIISLDFNKFNQKWRKESTERVFRTFDELFGTPGLYTFSHVFFEYAFFYLSSTFRPPTYLTAKSKEEVGMKKLAVPIFDSEITWRGQAGGCEGLRQKGWTAIIGSMLAANEFETGMSSWIIGQGDNQVIVVAIPTPELGLTEEDVFELYPQYVTDKVKSYLENLEKLTKGIGMDLKLEESWVSTSLLNYGKEIIFSGSYASSTVKKISRAYQEISELYPTLQNRVASLFTSSQACCMKGFDILVPYFISLIETLALLDKESDQGTTLGNRMKLLLRGHRVQLDQDLKICALILPNECGGLPILPFPSFLYRGHPDSMTLHMLWIRHLSKFFVQASRIFDLIVLGHFHDDKRDFLHLIQDPQSINFKRPVMSYNKLKEGLTDSLKNNTRNPMIKTLMNNCNEKTLRKQAEFLITAEPCFPRVLNEILRLSPDGSMLSFLSTFTNMRTMKGLLPPELSHDLVRTLRKGDLSLLDNLINIKKIVATEEYKRTYKSMINGNIDAYLRHWRKCITKTVQELRDSSWGISISGVTTPHPIEQTTIGISQGNRCSLPTCKEDEFILYVVQAGKQDHPMKLEEHFKRGSVKHYLGSGTSEKRSGPILNYPKNEKALRAAQQLLRVKNWIVSQNPENTLKKFVDELIQSRTDASEDFLILTSGVNYGGSVQHRFSDVTSKHECRPTIRVNMHSRVSICSDELGKYARGKENYPILFQAHYLYVLNKIHHLVLYYPEVLQLGNISIHQHMTCEGCLPVLVENPIESSGNPPPVPSLKNCPLVFASVEKNLVKIPMAILENVEKIVPVKDDKLLLERSACIASLILEGSVHIGVTPVIHSGLKQYRSDGSLVCLTVGFFLKIGMKRLFQWLSRIWILDNLPLVLNRARALDCSMSEACESILISFPDHAWDLIKPYLCVQEIQSEMRRKLDMFTTSSETFLTGKGIGYAISQYLIDLIKSLPLEGSQQSERMKAFKLPIISNAPGISLNRAMFIWVNSVILTSTWRSLKHLNRIVSRVREVSDSVSSKESVNISALIVSIANIEVGRTSLAHAAGICRPILSKVGAEPWIAPAILPEPPVMRKVVICSGFLSDTEVQARAKILEVAKEIGYHIECELYSSVSSESMLSLPANVEYPAREPHFRVDHQYRLVGQFSTAALKYLTIFSMEGISSTNASIHLAEGAGGVARAAALVLGSKIIVYNSLFSVEGIMGHRTYRYKPAELQGLGDVCIKGPEVCYQTGGDITSSRTRKMLRSEIAPISSEVKVVTCDAEFPSDCTISQACQLVLSMFKVIKHCNVGTLCVFKTFCRLPELLKYQVRIFKNNCSKVKIVVPKYSSNEASEVFLVGRYKGKTDLRIPTTISVTDDNAVEDVKVLRNQEKPFLRSTQIGILRNYWKLLNQIGITYNIMAAVQIFVNHSVSQTTMEENLLLAMSFAIESSHASMMSRLESKSKMLEAENLSLTQKLRIKSVKKDQRELQLLSETIINANIIRDIKLLSRVSEDYWVKPYVLKVEGMVLYKTDISISDWLNRYSRSFEKIIGFERFLKGNPVIIPNFLTREA